MWVHPVLAYFLIWKGMYLQNDLIGDTAGSGRCRRALDGARMPARAWLKMEEPLGYSIR